MMSSCSSVSGSIPLGSSISSLQSLPSETSILRHSRKNIMRKVAGAHRRISCKDLGAGDCQGWLWKKRETGGVLSHKWSKRWFVMKKQNLYYYKDQEDTKAEGVLYLPGFKVSPAPEIKSKKYAFKAHHTGTTFYFAAERQDDMTKWMNKLGLAAITYDCSGSIRPANASYRPDSPPYQILLNNAGYYSESEGETSESSTPSSPQTPRATTPVQVMAVSRSPSNSPSISPLRGTSPAAFRGASPAASEVSEADQLAKVYRNIRGAHLLLDGSDIRSKRASTMAPPDQLASRNSKEIAISRKLSSLERTLKAKMTELDVLENLLESPSSAALTQLKDKHPHIIEHLNGEHSESSTQSDME